MTTTARLEFVAVGDLVGMKHGVLEEDSKGRRILVSPAIYSLLETDKNLVLPGLMVSTDAGLVWVMDLA